MRIKTQFLFHHQISLQHVSSELRYRIQYNTTCGFYFDTTCLQFIGGVKIILHLRGQSHVRAHQQVLHGLSRSNRIRKKVQDKSPWCRKDK